MKFCGNQLKKWTLENFMDPILDLVLKRVSKFVIPKFRDTPLVSKITKCGDLLYFNFNLKPFPLLPHFGRILCLSQVVCNGSCRYILARVTCNLGYPTRKNVAFKNYQPACCKISTQLYKKLVNVFPRLCILFQTGIFFGHTVLGLIYRKVASRSTCYYSENQVLGGATNRDMSLNETCYYS